jgi:hypothetical protein
MNKRIEEVLDQVLGMEEFEHVDEFLDTAFVKKFAELLVRGCAQFVEDEFDFIGDEIIVKEKMLEHFGIEE